MSEERIEVYEDEAGEHRWRWVAANNRRMADSGEGYENEAGVIEAARHVRGAVGPPIVREDGTPIDELEEGIAAARRQAGGEGTPFGD